EKKKKPVLHAEDEFELLKTLYTSMETTFPHERYRVQLALIMQLAGITGNRPAALLAVRYRHIKVTLLPDPEGGEQPRVLIEIVFHHTKGYLGEKDANTVGGIQISEEQALADTTLRPQMTNLGIITGMELPTGPYTFRRGNGQALRAAGYVFAERVQAIDALFTFATSSTEEECQRRVTAINALIGLCKKQENQGFRRRRADIKVKEEQTSVSLPPSLSETLPVECEATQCIFCLGNEDLSAADRLKAFAARGGLKKISIASISATIATVSRSRAPIPGAM
ncbi:MAG: hypothetical protein Q9223_007893, partial [Gallowayella weberi]